MFRRAILRLGSTESCPERSRMGCQPVAFGSLAESNIARSAISNPTTPLNLRTEIVRGKLPRTTGQRPVLPGNRGNVQ